MGFGNISAARDLQSNRDSVRPKKVPTYQREVWSLIPDESIVVRFVGGPAEPHIFSQHGFSRLPNKGFEKGICSRPDECVLCMAASVPGEKRVKRASPYAAFTVYSTRKMQLIPFQREDGSTGNRTQPIRVNEAGEYITKDTSGRTVVVNAPDPQDSLADEGLKIWCGSLHPKAANADQILALDTQLQKVCQCGKRVGTGLNARPAEIHEHDGVLVCTADCGNPKRGSLTACYVQITRRGQGTDTTYHFRPLPFSEPNEEHVLESLPLAEVYKADPADQAQKLEERGISPSGRGSVNTDDNIWN